MASTRGCRSASSSPTSAACTGSTRAPRARRQRAGSSGSASADRAGAKVEELSHGNQQRAQLAAALLHEPELLVLDEPFAGLDPVAVQTLAEVLRGEAARGTAVLFSSHQLELVEDICEEVAIVDHGRIVATGDVDELRRASQRRRITLQLDGAPPQWLPDVAGVELVERRNGDLRLLAGRDVDPEQVLAAAERSARVLEFSYGPPTLAELFLELVASMSGRRAITLVARREIRERLRSKVFLVSTLVLLLIVGGSTALNGALSKKPTYRVAVTAPAPAGLLPALQRAARPFDNAKVRLRVVASAAAGRQALEAKQVDALLLLSDDRLVFRSNVDPKAAAVADTAVRALRNHLPPAPELTTATLHPPEKKTTDAETLVAYVGSLLLLMSLAVYGQWVVTGVVEEKNNRVVELILSTTRPRHLLAGKVIGIGLLGFAQLALVAGLAATLLAAGVFDAPAGLGGSLALVIPWFALGFALYAVAYAAAGALASRQQNAETAGQPVTYTLLAAYFAGYIALNADMNGLAANVLTVFPLTAPLVLPARSALVGVPLWEHALAVVLVLASIYALVRFAGRVYGHGLLHTGPRLDPRTAWRLTRQP